MHATLKYLMLMSTSAVVTTGAAAQSAKDILGPSPLLAIVNEPLRQRSSCKPRQFK
ncbi:MAG: hypothetical protein H7Z40_08685 [Phycisphaerae bacterium]|nr:hypothetical protein [Gemmatimonadaceae bacterium]